MEEPIIKMIKFQQVDWLATETHEVTTPATGLLRQTLAWPTNAR
jgi:hypothetical protein